MPQRGNISVATFTKQPKPPRRGGINPNNNRKFGTGTLLKITK